MFSGVSNLISKFSNKSDFKVKKPKVVGSKALNTATSIFQTMGNQIQYPFKKHKYSVQKEGKLRINLKSSKGASITCTVKDDKQTYSQEEMQRVDSIEVHKQICLKTLSDLQKKNKENPSDELKAKIKFYEGQLRGQRLHRESYPKKLWISTNHFRDDINRRKDFKESAKRYLFAPINFRRHRFGASTLNQSALRLGAICDPTNGFTNLKELKALDKAERQAGYKIKELEELKEKIKGERASAQQMDSIDFAIEELKNIPKTLIKRREGLSMQMLSYIEQHMTNPENKVADMENGETFIFFQLSALNPRLQKLDRTGWMHDESNMMLDMAEIFKEFEGKKVICDGEGPYIDADGAVHLSERFLNEDGTPKEIELMPLFANKSVQRTKQNVGAQVYINLHFTDKLNELKNIFPKESVRAARHEANRKESTYSSAVKLLRELAAHVPVGINCAGAKDRTTVLVHNLVTEASEKNLEKLEKEGKVSKKRANEAKRKIRARIFSKKSAAAEMAYDNTGVKVLKVTPLILPGHKDPKSLAKRVTYYGKQAVGLFRP